MDTKALDKSLTPQYNILMLFKSLPIEQRLWFVYQLHKEHKYQMMAGTLAPGSDGQNFYKATVKRPQRRKA